MRALDGFWFQVFFVSLHVLELTCVRHISICCYTSSYISRDISRSPPRTTARTTTHHHAPPLPGAWGLQVTRGSQRVTVSRNLFTDCAAGGVYVGDVNETQADYLYSVGVPLLSDINVADNVVDGVGTEYQVTMSTTS
jgi:hypothetical protein